MVTEPDERAMDRLFYVLREKYGSYWVILLGDEPIGDIKARWLKRLKRYTNNDIGKAIENVKKIHPKRPPGLDDFVALIKQLKGSRPGHLSDEMWNQERMDKTKGSGFRQRIREDYGI